MPEQLRIFIDYWNLQLQWNERTQKAPLDWTKLPSLLVEEAGKISGLGACEYQGTKLYASVDKTSSDGRKLTTWLVSFIDRLPGVNVEIREREPKPFEIHCRECKTLITTCPKCSRRLRKAVEKGVDTAIVTDLFSLAWAKAYTTAVLVSSDSDFVPAVKNLQEKGLKIINATWSGLGLQLARTSWASLVMDAFIPRLTR
jgi:uncharacterized LabA/DUF88 family protein